MTMVRGTFSIAEQQKCTNSVYIKSRGFAVVKSKDGKNILLNCYMTSGLLKREKDLRAAKYGLMSTGNLIAYGAAPGALEAHNFSKGLDINSPKGGKRGGKKTLSEQMLNSLVIRVGFTTLGSDEEE